MPKGEFVEKPWYTRKSLMMNTIQATGPKPLVLDHFRHAPIPNSITSRKGGVVIRPIWPEPTTERGNLQLKS